MNGRSIILLPCFMWLFCLTFELPAVLTYDGAKLAVVDVVVVDVGVEAFEVCGSLDRGFVASGDEAHYLGLARLPCLLKLPTDETAKGMERLFREKIKGAPLGGGDYLCRGTFGRFCYD